MDIRELVAEKKGILRRLKEIETILTYMTKEMEILEGLAKKAQENNVDALIRARKKLEYKLVTMTPNARAERRYLNKIKELDKKIEENRPYLEARRRLKVLQAQQDALQAEKEELLQKLEEINAQLKKVKEERRREKKKAAPAKPVIDEMTTLESLVEIEEE
ncbi:MAG: V-type ATPase 116kDa subunit family protein [Candidatus Micrarchaeota archaeon]|nr:V-type ATPase 116kDa subunit family protein [Candidatus Micrarchaeota archaeon]